MTRLSVRACVLASAFVAMPTSSNARHVDLKRSDPAQNSRLQAPPTRIRLWFTERPQSALSRVRVIGPAGDVALGKLAPDTGNMLRVDIQGTMDAGAYRVVWQTATVDGHVIRGEYSFVLLGRGQIESTGVSQVASVVDPPMGQAQPLAPFGSRLARWFEFSALLVMLGALGFRHGVLPALATRHVQTAGAADRARRLGLAAGAFYVVAALARLAYQVLSAELGDHALDPDVAMAIVTGSAWGLGWALGVAGALLVVVAWTVLKRTNAVGTPIALTGALGLAMSPALSGHAVSNGPFVLSVTLDAVHVGAIGVWLGGLLMVLVAGIPAMRQLSDGDGDAAVSALVSSFHPLALLCAPVAVLAGVGSSWIRLGSLPALTSTPYGWTLLLKIGLVALVGGMGAYNATRARRRLGATTGTRRFVGSASMELAFAGLVLVVTTALVATPLPSAGTTP